MNQPPKTAPPEPGFSPPLHHQPPPQWQRPRGVAPGTWQYVNERTIADRYDEFVADTPLCRLDSKILHEQFPPLQSPGRDVVLDLGCGPGRASLPLARLGYDVVAIDLSTPMLRVTVAKSAATATPGRIFPLRANLVELDGLADDSADHAVCLFSTLGMIQGRQHRQAMLRHVARILRAPSQTHPARGRMLLHVHNRWSALLEPGGWRRLATSWCRARGQADWEFGDWIYAYRGLDRMFIHRFSRREILSDLVACGWQIETVRPIAVDGTRIDQSTRLPGGYLITCRGAKAGQD